MCAGSKKEQMDKLLFLSINTALEAGKAISEIYKSGDWNVELKDDDSPLTSADLASNEIITRRLTKTGLPILSEEGKNVSYVERSTWNLFWMVDPLDGTKEFVKRNGEFTVNIALIEEGRPVSGVIYAPELKVLYYGDIEEGSFKIENITYDSCPKTIGQLTEMSVKLPVEAPTVYTILASKSHLTEKTEKFIDQRKAQCPEISVISVGSSLKFCWLAEGKAHVYPRFGPTMEWDTAAGHAILKYASGEVTVAGTNKELEYNKEVLVNPDFIAKSYLIDENVDY